MNDRIGLACFFFLCSNISIIFVLIYDIGVNNGEPSTQRMRFVSWFWNLWQYNMNANI